MFMGNLYTVVTAEAQVSAVASFNDSRCAGEMVCPNDPLFFTCTITEIPSALAEVRLPSGELTFTNMTQVIGATSLPDRVTVYTVSQCSRGWRTSKLHTNTGYRESLTVGWQCHHM